MPKRLTSYPARYTRKINRSNLPTEAGRYYWSEYKAVVEVTKRGKFLYVTPPMRGAIEVKVSPMIAGEFTKVDQ